MTPTDLLASDPPPLDGDPGPKKKTKYTFRALPMS